VNRAGSNDLRYVSSHQRLSSDLNESVSSICDNGTAELRMVKWSFYCRCHHGVVVVVGAACNSFAL
jgi:hypothetical protein